MAGFFLTSRLLPLSSAFSLVLVVAGLVRVVGLDRFPPPFFRDEAEKGYNAYCLVQTGCDYEGRRLPFFINAFGSHTSAIYQYATAPLVGLFGLHVWSVRLTAALVGLASVVFLFLLARALFDTATAVVAAALLAVSPWHVVFSRWAQQGIFMPFLFTVAVWGIVRFRQGWRPGLVVAAAAIGLSAYAYDVGRVLAPLFLLLLAVVARREIKQQTRWAVAAALVLGLLVAPTVWFTFRQSEAAMARFRRISIAADAPTPAHILGRFALNYVKHFDPSYLAGRGDREPRHSPQMAGQIYPLELLLLLAGFYFLAKRRDGSAALVICWILIAPVAASLTREGIPHALRSLAGVPAFALAAAVGAVEMVRRLPARTRGWAVAGLVAAELAGVAVFAFSYVVIEPRLHARSSWQAGLGEALAYVHSRQEPPAEVWVTESVGGLVVPPEIISPAEVLIAFHEKVPPAQFQRDRLKQTRFRVLPYGLRPSVLLTGKGTGPKYVIALVGEMAGVESAAIFATEPGSKTAVGVYCF